MLKAMHVLWLPALNFALFTGVYFLSEPGWKRCTAGTIATLAGMFFAAIVGLMIADRGRE